MSYLLLWSDCLPKYLSKVFRYEIRCRCDAAWLCIRRPGLIFFFLIWCDIECSPYAGVMLQHEKAKKNYAANSKAQIQNTAKKWVTNISVKISRLKTRLKITDWKNIWSIESTHFIFELQTTTQQALYFFPRPTFLSDNAVRSFWATGKSSSSLVFARRENRETWIIWQTVFVILWKQCKGSR